MKKQRRGVNRYNMLTRRKKEEKVSFLMHDTLKLTVKKKKKKKKKKPCTGFETHINENSHLLSYICILKNMRSTYCAIESLENSM